MLHYNHILIKAKFCFFTIIFILLIQCTSFQVTGDNRLIFMKLIDTNYVIDDKDLLKLTKVTDRLYLYQGIIISDGDIDTCEFVLKKDNLSNKIVLEKEVNLKICNYLKCFKLYLNNQKFIDKNHNHVFLLKDSLNKQIRFGEAQRVFLNLYFAEEW